MVLKSIFDLYFLGKSICMFMVMNQKDPFLGKFFVTRAPDPFSHDYDL